MQTGTKIEGKMKQAQKAANEGLGKAILLCGGGGLTLMATAISPTLIAG